MSDEQQLIDAYEVGQELTDLIGIERIKSVEFRFAMNEIVSANVEFLVGRETCHSLLKLCRKKGTFELVDA